MDATLGATEAAAVQQRVDAVTAGDLRAGARLITQAESGDAAIRPVLQALYKHGGHADIIGVTGPPGAGKSTLVDQLVGLYRKAGKRVAVLAVDPSSPFSGGALLGDRLRMGRHDADAGVFIRSMASRGALGGLAKAVGDALTILDAMGWDVIIVETVGIGQNEIDIVRHASCIVLLQTPLSGDAIQTSKAGMLEIGDIFVVNKADTLGSERMVNALNEMLHDRAFADGMWPPVVVATEANSGRGVDALHDTIQHRFEFLAAHPEAAKKLQLAQLRARVFEIAKNAMLNRVMHELDNGDKHADLFDAVLSRALDPHAIAEALLAAQSPVHSSMQAL